MLAAPSLPPSTFSTLNTGPYFFGFSKNIIRSKSHGQDGQGTFSRCTKAEKKRIQSQSNKEMGFYLRRRGKPTHLWRPEIRVFCAESRGVEDDHCAHFMVIHLVKDVCTAHITKRFLCLPSTKSSGVCFPKATQLQ